MTSTLTNRDTYLAQLLALTSPPATPQLLELRTQAAAYLQEETLPSNKDEEWRFTNLDPLLTQTFAAPDAQLPPVNINGLILPEATNTRIVFVNGIYAPLLSSLANLPAGVFIGNLAAANAAGLEISKYLGKQPGGEEVFTAINTAGINEAAVVWLAPDIAFETPIHLLFITTVDDTAIATQPRALIVLEQRSSATLIQEYLHTSIPVGEAPRNEARPYFNNAVTEVWLGDTAKLNHTRIQDEDITAIHIGKTAVSQSQHSAYTGTSIELGSKLSRHNWEIFQIGAQTETYLNGLTMVNGEQESDTHSTIALTKPHGITDQLHKCIVDDRAHAIFNGKVFVPQAAQQTNAGQLNRNLLLSSTARIDTKPQLEITADNVKCSHGATVSQLEDDEIFYLQSRGLDVETAKILLINAFAVEIIDRIPVASVREKLAVAVKAFKAN
ncbi:Fe-S cluster assembly protein SufD [Chamaesiphon polymorphus]|uniref:Fe-S cluster assembly protein SufD n=1 Tax=Chamaesiphon polymorphus CCALA 037 TaxID=2107692 RepID=A0A2T1GBQ2_9CYAN|nr:Fe-S cluster assembly protein SufD [Chamaesiphon polymorphus]PSB54697.1 Fe-S cluster assembly protein SufD [Chamaesiphon polymorphus CCALA 037]